MKNEFFYNPDGTASIVLAQGRIALVDVDDLPALANYRWCAARSRNTYYVFGHVGRQTVTMHRILLPNSEEVDHRNGNGLDNRRSNIRPCTRRENARNRRRCRASCSVYKGVFWRKDKHKWYASIKKNDKNRHLGYFHSEIEAAQAYDASARVLFGEFARTNF